MKKRNDALVVEMLLRVWEDVCFYEQLRAFTERGSMDPALRNVSVFRNYLATMKPGDVFDEARFTSVDPEVKFVTGVMKSVPALITEWVTKSKRIYRLSTEMQTRFTEIAFGNMRLSDVLLPFNVFGIQLASPVTISGVEYGFIFVWSVLYGQEDRPHLNILLLPQSLKDYGGLDTVRREQTLKDLQDPRHTQRGIKTARTLMGQLDRLLKHVPTFTAFSIFPEALQPDSTVEELLLSEFDSPDAASSSEIRKQCLHIAFNLCLYLQSLPPGAEKEEGVEWKTEYLKKVIFAQPVTIRKTEVCDIVGHHIIDSMIIDRRSGTHRGNGGREMEPQWRRAHTRRPPGKGKDPTAEKTVKVRHYLIREDLAEQGRPIRGSVTEVR